MSEKTDFNELLQHYGLEEMNRVTQVFGSYGSPDAKPIGHNIKKMVVGKNPTKRDMGGIVKALDDYARVVHIRLEFLRLTIDEGLPQHIARAKLAQQFELSKKRISNLTVIKN